MSKKHIVRHKAEVDRNQRARLNRHGSVVVWFTGLPSSGKSTIAHAVEKELFRSGCRTFVLDGDNIRHGLCSDLGFSDRDRTENLRRIGETAKLFVEAGAIALAAFISPKRKDRSRVRRIVGKEDYLEVYCDCPVEVCEKRDPKGNYRKAREGAIRNYTGISAPYEPPASSDLILRTDRMTAAACAERVLTLLRQRKIVR